MRVRLVISLALLALLSASVVSSAQVGLYAQTGYTTYALGELNRLIDAINDYREGLGGEHNPMKHIKGGLTVAAGLDFPVSDVTSVRAGIEYLSLGKSVGTRSGAVWTVAEPMGTTEKSVVSISGRALGYTVGGTYLLLDDDLEVSASAGVGHYTVSKAFSVVGGSVAPAGTTASDYEINSSGSGLGFNLGLDGTYELNTNTDLQFGVGYRYLKISEIRSDGTVIPGLDDDSLELDLSGFTLRGGVVFRF